MVGSGRRRASAILGTTQCVSDPRVVAVLNPQVVPPGSNVAAIDARTGSDLEGCPTPQEPGFSAYLRYIPGHGRTHPEVGSRTQNPVVREHRVGSSSTSGTFQHVAPLRDQLSARSLRSLSAFQHASACGLACRVFGFGWEQLRLDVDGCQAGEAVGVDAQEVDPYFSVHVGVAAVDGERVSVFAVEEFA
jgi:hypothetical protein